MLVFWSLPRQNTEKKAIRFAGPFVSCLGEMQLTVGVNWGDLVGFTIDDRNKHLPSQKHYMGVSWNGGTPKTPQNGHV